MQLTFIWRYPTRAVAGRFIDFMFQQPCATHRMSAQLLNMVGIPPSGAPPDISPRRKKRLKHSLKSYLQERRLAPEPRAAKSSVAPYLQGRSVR